MAMAGSAILGGDPAAGAMSCRRGNAERLGQHGLAEAVPGDPGTPFGMEEQAPGGSCSARAAP